MEQKSSLELLEILTVLVLASNPKFPFSKAILRTAAVVWLKSLKYRDPVNFGLCTAVGRFI